jgi:hypothetical protein
MQLQLVQPELHHLTGQFGRYPVRWEQGNLPGLGIPFLERRQRLTPRGLLRVIDLAQVQHLPLDHALIGSPVVFHDTPIAMWFTVLEPGLETQEHASIVEKMPRKSRS